MQEREVIPLTDLTICYLGPLFLLLVPGMSEESPLMRRTIREGMILFLTASASFFLLRLLSETPIFGILFRTMLIFLWILYVLVVVWIVVHKHSDSWFQVPFLSTYADQIGSN